MKIDNYSKAIGIIYATSRMMHPLDEGLDSVALKMYNEALGLLEKGNYPEPVKESPKDWGPNGTVSTGGGITTTEGSILHLITEPAPEPEPETFTVTQQQIPQPEPKASTANVWGPGEDSYIRVSASADEAVCNRPLGSRKTDTQVKNKWYYLKQRKMLLSKGDRVWYQGNNENLCQKFTPAGRGAILGSISAITDDKTSATVFFDGDKSAYQIPICDIIRAGEA